MANYHTYLLFGGIALAIIGIILLIGAGVFNGVTGNIDGWFWSLLIAGAVLVVVGLVLLVVGWAMAPSKKEVAAPIAVAAPMQHVAAPVAAPAHHGGHTSTSQVTGVSFDPNTGQQMAHIESTHNIPAHHVQGPSTVVPGQQRIIKDPDVLVPGQISSTPGHTITAKAQVPLNPQMGAESQVGGGVRAQTVQFFQGQQPTPAYQSAPMYPYQ